MREVELDGRKMDTRALAHAYLKKALQLPEHYGANLDALADCLGELGGLSIVLAHQQAMVNALGEYGVRMLRVFRDAAGNRPDFRFRVQSD